MSARICVAPSWRCPKGRPPRQPAILEPRSRILTAPILEIQGLHKKFGATEVLKGVDLDMASGDVVSIIGSSGSGKTTMLRCVNLLEEFQQGSIRIDGQ